MNNFEYRINIFVSGILMALAWSWLPYLIYNFIALITGILPFAGLLGYALITAAIAGSLIAIIEYRNPRDYTHEI